MKEWGWWLLEAMVAAYIRETMYFVDSLRVQRFQPLGAEHASVVM